MHLVDTHQHLWDPSKIPIAWCEGHPVLDRRFDLGDYMAASEGCGVTKTLFMECDVDDAHQLEEAQSIQRLAVGNPLIAGIVASGRPENPRFPDHLDKLAALDRIRGLRRVLHVVPDGVSQQALFRENLRRLPSYRLTFDVCALSRQLPLVLELILACPDVTFVLDHCGGPDVKGRTLDPWRSDMLALSEQPNISCKISGLVTHAAAAWTAADLRPWIEHVIQCFGWDRVVWGGDWPVCTVRSPLRRWVATTHELLAGCTPEQTRKLLCLNAERIYRI